MKIKVFGLIFLAALFGSGCASRMPLKNLPPIQGATLHVDTSGKDICVRTESAQGRNARLAGGSGGLIGLTTAELIAVSTQGNSKKLINDLRKENAWPEDAILDQCLKYQIKKVGLTWSEQIGEPTLSVQLDLIGLEEMQSGFWRVTAQVSARVRDVKSKTIWKVHLNASSTSSRRLEDFSREPHLYVDDFREAAEDAARQLIAGPIRN